MSPPRSQKETTQGRHGENRLACFGNSDQGPTIGARESGTRALGEAQKEIAASGAPRDRVRIGREGRGHVGCYDGANHGGHTGDGVVSSGEEIRGQRAGGVGSRSSPTAKLQKERLARYDLRGGPK